MAVFEFAAIYTTDPAYRQFVVPVSISMSSSATCSAQPAMVETTIPAGASTISRFVRIRSRLPGQIVIDKVTADHPALTCTWARGPENAATVRIRVDAGRLDGPIETAVRIHLSAPQKEILNIPVLIDQE